MNMKTLNNYDEIYKYIVSFDQRRSWAKPNETFALDLQTFRKILYVNRSPNLKKNNLDPQIF